MSRPIYLQRKKKHRRKLKTYPFHKLFTQKYPNLGPPNAYMLLSVFREELQLFHDWLTATVYF